MRTRLLLIPVLLLTLSFHSALAGGIYLYELGSPDVGRASAGWAARANDAFTAFSNPAGMTRLDGSRLLLGLQPLYIQAEFAPDASTTTSGGGGDNAGGLVPAGGAFYVNGSGDRFRWGVSAASYAGLGLEYDETWAGRYYVLKAELLTFSIIPTVAYQLSETFSIGAGPAITISKLSNTAAINNVADALPDGDLEAEATDLAIGAIAGILYEPRAGTRFGLTYVAPTKADFADVLTLNGLGPGLEAVLTAAGLTEDEIDMSMTFPQTVMFSVYHELSPRLAAMANVGWQEWEEFGKVDVEIASDSPTSLTVENKFENTWTYALGFELGVSDVTRLSAGFAYDDEAVTDENRTVAFPIDRNIRYSAGWQRDLSERTTIGFAYTYLDAGKAPLSQRRGPLSGTLSGEFDTNRIHIMALSFDRKL